VRLIGADGTQFGVLSIREALDHAQRAGLDLVEVSPTAAPPVCKVMDFGKYMYQQKKKLHDARKKQKVFHVKEVVMRPAIDQHDYDTKKKNVIRFLEQGDKVKIVIRFRGRELAHTDFGERRLAALITEVKDYGEVESPPMRMERNITTVLAPKLRKEPEKPKEKAKAKEKAPAKEKTATTDNA
jgi:translation initiation factor IF-3